jgi:hypothetical protein
MTRIVSVFKMKPAVVVKIDVRTRDVDGQRRVFAVALLHAGVHRAARLVTCEPAVCGW